LRGENQTLHDEIIGLRASSEAIAVETHKLNAWVEALEPSLLQALDQGRRRARPTTKSKTRNVGAPGDDLDDSCPRIRAMASSSLG
jgi:hypothetical protein